MAAMTTFDGVAEGSDIAVVMNANTAPQRWKMGPGGVPIDRNGDPLDTWFFAGLLADGKVFEADFTPPRTGEWFRRNGYTHRYYLAVRSEENGVCDVYEFAHGTFRGHLQLRGLLDISERVEPPAEAMSMLLSLIETAERWRVRADQHANVRGTLDYLASDLVTIRSYLERSEQRVSAMRGAT